MMMMMMMMIIIIIIIIITNLWGLKSMQQKRISELHVLDCVNSDGLSQRTFPVLTLYKVH